MKIGIVDDEYIQLEQVHREVQKWQSERKYHLDIYTFQSGNELLKHCVVEDNAFDIVFLDMQMKDMDGIQTGKQIRTRLPECVIIYVTNYLDSVCESFKVGAFRYILKNNLHKAIEEALDSASQQICDNTQYFQFSAKKQDAKVSYNKILYFESCKRIIKLALIDGSEKEFYGKMSAVEEQISNRLFVRCHQSYVVNAKYIERVEGNWLYLCNDTHIPISSKYTNAIENAIMWSER